MHPLPARGLAQHFYNGHMFLDIRQLDVRYAGRDTPAVRGVTLGLPAGDIGVLIGPSGCGKTKIGRAHV